MRKAIRNLTVISCAALLSTHLDAESTGGAITTDGMAGVTVGMTQRQVAPLIGGHINADCYETKFGKVIIERGIVVLAETQSPRLATRSGARVGMTDSALRKLYPGRLRRTDTPNDFDTSSWTYWYYSSSGNGLRFDMRNGRVSSIAAGKIDVITRESFCS